MHVDDCEVCGDPRELHKFEQSLEKEFGSVKEQIWNFRHCGIEYKQSKDLTRLQHSQCECINAMKYYPLGKERGKQVASPLNAQEARLQVCFGRPAMGQPHSSLSLIHI